MADKDLNNNSCLEEGKKNSVDNVLAPTVENEVDSIAKRIANVSEGKQEAQSGFISNDGEVFNIDEDGLTSIDKITFEINK